MTPGERHSERPDGRQEEVKLDVEVVDRLDVERVKELCGHDVQLNLGETLSRASCNGKVESAGRYVSTFHWLGFH